MAYNGQERRKRNWWPLVGYAILLIGLLVALNRVQESNLDKVRTAEYTACERVQLLRDQANGTNFLVYDTFLSAYRREIKLIKGDPENAEKHRMSADTLEKTYRTTTVTGPTNCHDAVYEADTYKAPVPQFIHSGGPQVAAAKKRAQAIIGKAYANEPLYSPGDLRGR